MRFNYNMKTCARCKRIFNPGMVQHCKHPRVQEYFGEDICLYCCKRCRHHTTVPYLDGVGCGFEGGEHRV